MTRQLHFYFDYLSPYAYFAWRRVRDVAKEHDAQLVLHPTLLAALLNHHGHKGPAEIAPKRAFVIKDTLRYAARHGFEIDFPKPHPFNPLTALRLSLPGPDQERRIDAIFMAGWRDGRDLSDRDLLADALSADGLDGPRLVAATRTPEVKDALLAQSQAAIERGIFGVPSFIVDGELLWGNDRIADVIEVLTDRDPLDRQRAEAIIAAPRGAQRQR